jgi:hypothetical protein
VVASPLTGHALEPLSRHTLTNPDTQAEVSWSTNSLGLRGPEWTIPKAPGVFRILCLGDENILAPEVEDHETACAVLQELLQSRCRLQVEVVNAGVPGYCPLLEFLQLRNQLGSLQPDVILLNFDMSDVADDHRHRCYAHVGSDGLAIACSCPELESPGKTTVQSLYERFELIKMGREYLQHALPEHDRSSDSRDINAPAGAYAWLADDPPDWSLYIRQALAPIEHAATCAAGFRARFLLATYPAPWQVSAIASSGPGVRESAGIGRDAHLTSRAAFDALQAFAQQRRIRYLDASPAFLAVRTPERLYMENAPRFSRDGNKFYAYQLANFVMAQVPEVWSTSSGSPASSAPAPIRQVEGTATPRSDEQPARLPRPSSRPLRQQNPTASGASNGASR